MKEIRSINNSEFRIEPNSRRIEGYALLFNNESLDLGGFTEIIDRNSLDGILEISDILALHNHKEDDVLARNTYGQGTLALNVDDKGLKYSFDAPNTPLGTEVLDAIRRGDLRNSSFAFSVNEQGQKWEKRGDKYVRTITKFEKLYDVSPVYRPAYQDTTVALRSLKDFSSIQELSTEQKEYIDKMNERQEINVELKIEIEGDKKEDMPTDIMTPDMPIDAPEDTPSEDIPMDMPMDMPMDEPVDAPVSELIDVVIDGEVYSIPKEVIDPYINSRKLELYFERIEKSINDLKK